MLKTVTAIVVVGWLLGYATISHALLAIAFLVLL